LKYTLFFLKRRRHKVHSIDGSKQINEIHRGWTDEKAISCHAQKTLFVFERKLTMNSKYTAVATLVLAALATGNALAADPAAAKTRAEVQAELQAAQRSGNIVDAATGEKLNVLYPSRYPTQAAAGRTRADVAAELQVAQRSGDIVDAATGEKLNVLYPSRYPTQATAGRTRADVVQELFEARRNGDIVDAASGEKLNVLYPSRYPTKG
jgi:hypothetical protein